MEEGGGVAGTDLLQLKHREADHNQSVLGAGGALSWCTVECPTCNSKLADNLLCWEKLPCWGPVVFPVCPHRLGLSLSPQCGPAD